MLLPHYIKPGLGLMFYWLLEKNEINFESDYPNPQAFKLNDFVKLVGVMTKEDYLNLEIKGISKSKFEHMTTPKNI